MSMKRLLKIFSILVLLMMVSSVFAEDFSFSMFNSKLTEEEKAKLLNGEMLIRNVDTKKNMCLLGVNDNTNTILNSVDKLDPNYTAEVIRIMKDDEAREISVTDQLESILLRLEDYAGIPYFSERHNRYYDLYKKVELKNSVTNGDTRKMTATYAMDPFGVFDCDINLKKNGDDLYYMQENLDKLRYYDKFTCVKPNNMHIYITSFKCEGYTVLYALGGVAAPSIFFIRDRVETSFINRIKTFCQYMFEKLIWIMPYF